MAFSNYPNRAVMGVPGLSLYQAKACAITAAREARSLAPKLTVASSSQFKPIYGEGWFGITWQHDYVYFQEVGIRPFTMRSLAGKVIPMWINDPTGQEAQKNPKAKTRVTADGRKQVLIFRRAAKIGQRKNAWRNVDGRMVRVSVPASYPGAPGRIAVNRSRGILRVGDIDPNAANPGQIAKGNVGVRWRHPGLGGKRFLAEGIHRAALANGIPFGAVLYRGGRSETTADPSYRTIIYREED